MSETTDYFRPVRSVTLRTGRGEPITPPFPGKEYDDWLFVGIFLHEDIRSDCNCRMLLATMQARAGRESFRHSMTYDGVTGKPIQSFVIVSNLDRNAIAVAQDCMQLHDEGEHISDEFYWQEIDVHLQRMWAGMSMPERIDAVKRTNTPHQVVLETEVSEEDFYDLWVYLYQEMGL